MYLTRPRLSKKFPTRLLPFISEKGTFAPLPTSQPLNIAIKPITKDGHPACGQNGLFAKQRIPGQTLVTPYLGVIHATFTPENDTLTSEAALDVLVTDTKEHDDSDYDLSLLRLSASDTKNPYPGYHISIGVDANTSGNAARMVNDYRGIADRPNAEFRVGRGEGGELLMEIWSLKQGVNKGEEILISYGKGWWGARNT